MSAVVLFGTETERGFMQCNGDVIRRVSEPDQDQRMAAHWHFEFFFKWECRLTMAGVIDILRLCLQVKNGMEKDFTTVELVKFIAHLRQGNLQHISILRYTSCID